MKKIKIILPSFLLLIFTICFSYVYASFSDDFTINGIATIEKATIQIVRVDYNSMSGGASFTNISHKLNSVTLPVTLDPGASIMFDVHVTNYSNTNYEISDMQFNNDNLDVLYTKQGCFLADKINALNSYVCNITITNNGSSTISDTIITTYTYTPISDYTFTHHIETLTNGIDEGYIDDIKDDTSIANAYHYVGKNPRNYVLFKGEMWRILGLEYDVKSSLNGEDETKIKLVKESSIQSNKHIWDITNNIFQNMGRGTAEWSTSKLQATLNNLYYTSGSGSCYLTDKSKTTTSCNFATTGLSSSPIVSASVWHHGASNATPGSPIQMYQDLHGTGTPASSGCWGLGCSTGSFTTKSVNYVGLMSPSDYGFSTNGSNGRTRESCLNTALNNAAWKANGYCATTWLTQDNGNEWTIQPSIGDSYSWVFAISKDGIIDDDYAYKRYYIRPSIYLDPDTLYYSGSGLKDDPYIIEQSDASDVYVISFDPNGGVGNMPVQLFEKETNKALSPNRFTREGYSFLGWALTPDVTEAQFADMAYVTAISNATLYAVWFKETTIYDHMEEYALNTTIDFSKSSYESNTNGIYTYTGSNSDGGNKTIYYYRGNVNNNVLFANQCWKIIRTTSTGGAKLIYNGTPENGVCNGNTNNLTESSFNTINTAEAAGYMYESGIQHGLTYDSIVKHENDEFLYYNLRANVAYLEDITFCNDRSVQTGSTYSSTGSSFNFNRYSLGNPTLICPNASDNFTVDPSHGNGKLSMPVGMITADEMILAGAKNGASSENPTYYLKTDYQYWTATPRYWNGSTVKVWRVNTDGSIGTADNESNNKYFRPVIALNNTTFIAGGNGTTTDPFTIKNKTDVQYAVSYDGNGATSGVMTYQLAHGGEDLKLNPNAFAKTGYHFVGWTTRYGTGIVYEDEEYINVNEDLILYASWEKDVNTFTATGTIQSYNILRTGNYTIEACGAKGGDSVLNNQISGTGGNGGCITGTIHLNNGEILYIGVGKMGGSGTAEQSAGYNGGGSNQGLDNRSAGGGGATHIAIGETNRGVLSNYVNNKSEVIMAAGGGGGGGINNTGAAGGLNDGLANGALYGFNATVNGPGAKGTGGSHDPGSTDGSFGQGGLGGSWLVGAGGGGYYGGGGAAHYTPSSSGGGGGGSSYASSYFSNVTQSPGTNSSDGRVTITYIG